MRIVARGGKISAALTVRHQRDFSLKSSYGAGGLRSVVAATAEELRFTQ